MQPLLFRDGAKDSSMMSDDAVLMLRYFIAAALPLPLPALRVRHALRCQRAFARQFHFRCCHAAAAARGCFQRLLQLQGWVGLRFSAVFGLRRRHVFVGSQGWGISFGYSCRFRFRPFVRSSAGRLLSKARAFASARLGLPASTAVCTLGLLPKATIVRLGL